VLGTRRVTLEALAGRLASPPRRGVLTVAMAGQLLASLSPVARLILITARERKLFWIPANGNAIKLGGNFQDALATIEALERAGWLRRVAQSAQGDLFQFFLTPEAARVFDRAR